MTPEVKQRIEQIRQGIVPKGYKKTKTDIVPADWKESPIGEYIREYTEKTTIPNQYPVLTSARTGLMLQTDYYSNRQVTTEDNVGYNILPYGYITFRSRSDDGRFRFNENRIIERGVISYFYPVFSFSEEVCHEYMLYLLNFSIYRRMYPYAEGTSKQVLSLKKLGQLKYSLPLVAEQKKIAEILSTQDKAIELQGRKIEELKRFKKGCLEKMFPRKGQKVPEKRFPGFTGDWEQRKLGGVTTSYSGGTPTVGVKEYYDGQIPFIRSAEINSESTELFISEKGLNVSSARLVSKGDILYALYGATSGEVGRARLEGAINQAILAIKPMDNYDAEYLSQWLRKSKQNIVETYLQGGQGNLSGAIVKELIVDFPSYNEQQIIGQYFANLDRLITLHQRKLDEMKKQEKALMQLLLTGNVSVRL